MKKVDLKQKGYQVPQTVLLGDPVRHHIVTEDFLPNHGDQACPSLYSLMLTMKSAFMFPSPPPRSSPHSIKAFVELCESFILKHTGQTRHSKLKYESC